MIGVLVELCCLIKIFCASNSFSERSMTKNNRFLVNRMFNFNLNKAFNFYHLCSQSIRLYKKSIECSSCLPYSILSSLLCFYFFFSSFHFLYIFICVFLLHPLYGFYVYYSFCLFCLFHPLPPFPFSRFSLIMLSIFSILFCLSIFLQKKKLFYHLANEFHLIHLSYPFHLIHPSNSFQLF
jgi:hypothetical protein